MCDGVRAASRCVMVWGLQEGSGQLQAARALNKLNQGSDQSSTDQQTAAERTPELLAIQMQRLGELVAESNHQGALMVCGAHSTVLWTQCA